MDKSEEKWLKIMSIGRRLGCHQMGKRSFFWKQWQFPVCARCTGVIIGNILSLIFYWFIYNKVILLVISGVFSLIMLTDWLIQYFRVRESTNIRRLASGILGGFGVCCIFLYVVWDILVKMVVNLS